MKGMLVIISGPSGSGKGTVVTRLRKARNFALSISLTTRKPRPGERDGHDYFFTTQQDFFRQRDDDELLEHALYVGNYYGTPRRYVEEQISLGKALVLEIEANGALQVKAKFPDAVMIFLIPPTRAELYNRLIHRNTEDLPTIEERMRRAAEEIKLVNRYDYVVVNDTVDRAVAQIKTIVEAESLKPRRSKVEIEEFMTCQTEGPGWDCTR